MARAVEAPIARPVTRRGLRTAHRQDWLWAVLFLGPNLALFGLFMAWPVAYGFWISLHRWDFIRDPEWRGLDNYRYFFEDPLTPTLIENTIYYVVGCTLPLLVLALLCAVLLDAISRFKTFWRGVYFLPLVTSSVAAAVVWNWLYARDQGLINYALGRIGVDSIDWLYNTTWAMPAVIVMTVWKLLPFNTILFLAGLQEIPVHLYEAAEIDGASSWRRFRDITLPLITPTTFFVLLITMFGLLFGSFDIINVMTEGGPLDATNIFIYNIYQNAFQYFDMGYASAQAYLLFVVVFVLTVLNFRLQRRWVHY
jgi:multiple sugar transport system permease protein